MFTVRGTRRGFPPGWNTNQVGLGVHSLPGVDIFPDLCTRLWSKVQPELHFPSTTFTGKKDSSSTAQDLMKECDLVWYNTLI